MLGMRSYPKAYFAASRAKVDSDLAAYHKLVAAAQNQTNLAKALEGFEASYFNNMVLILDQLFVHRLRTVEGKDGNPLNEVRLLCDGLINNRGRLVSDKTIKYDPDQSVLKYKIGDAIKVTEADFKRLAKAYFAEIENKFSA